MTDSRQPSFQPDLQAELLDETYQATKSAYQELLDDFSDVILDSAPDGRIIFANAAACEIAGYRREDLLALNIRQLFAAECLNVVRRLADAARRDAIPDTVDRPSAEVILLARSGERVHLRLKARARRVNSRVESVRWIGRDLSELTQAQEHIQFLEEHARVVFQISPDAVSITRLSDGTYEEVNEGFLQSSGFTREELIGQSSLKLGIWVNPAERAELAAMLARSGEVHDMEIQFRRKDGRVASGLISARLTMLGGEPHVLSVTRDLTSWNQARKALRESEAHLEHAQLFEQRLLAAIDHASDEVVIFDKAGLIQYCNPALLRIIGRTREETIGQSATFLRSGGRGEELIDRIAATLQGGKAWSGRLSSRGKDGASMVEDATVSPIFGGMQDPIGVVAVSRDVTKQVTLEARLQQSERLESVGRLAGGVAHDFNNLLTVINGYSSLLLSSMNEADPARQKVSEIQKAGERAAELTRQLLAFSRTQIIHLRPLSLNTVIAEAEPMLRRVLGDGNELFVDLAPDLGPVVSDPGQLHQIFLNLALNARDAMPAGGRLTIRATNVEIDAALAALHPHTKPGPYVSCVVSDTGTGIYPEIQPYIFEPFFTTKAATKGTGLGLSTVYGIVLQNQGWIGVESEPGVGTAFTICLPRASSGCAPKVSRQASEDPGGTETILLVEDQGQVLRLAAEALSSRGYRVLTATSAEDALDQAGIYADSIDLLLSDVLMPGMNGRELAERLRVKRPGTAVLLMSGHDPEMASGHSEPDSRTSFISKPFTPQLLAAAVREILGRR
jgi:two-component system, cell cycle sensor histidine kinase and response regulator CckA